MCVFEFIYFARPDSILKNCELEDARIRMGHELAQEAPVEADMVVPFPDSGTPAAIGYAEASGIPFREALTHLGGPTRKAVSTPDHPDAQQYLGSRDTFFFRHLAVERPGDAGNGHVNPSQ